MIFAPIKINIALHVGPVKPDGYHPVDTLCVFPALGDVLTYEPEAPLGLDYTGPFGAALAQEPLSQNFVFRAFALLDVIPQGRFLLAKAMPLASGVGAGTADGVAAMLLLNDVLKLGCPAHELIERSRGLGADGPVCMAGQIAGGGLWRARGVGERLSFVGVVEPQAIVVAHPGLGLGTGRVFKAFDEAGRHPLKTVQVRRGLSLAEHVSRTRNDLEPVALSLAPSIGHLKSALADHPGAQAVRMSGSGATCYALHASLSSALRSARRLRAQGLWAEAAPLLSGNAGGLG